MWYPCGSFKGDDKSAALAKSYADGGLLAGISKNQIDSGVAGSLFRDQDKLKESICRAYPQLRKSSDEFEFGYRMAFEGLSEDKEQMVVIVQGHFRQHQERVCWELSYWLIDESARQETRVAGSQLSNKGREPTICRRCLRCVRFQFY
jgi:Family of unknown function (DUF6523)